MEENIKTTGKMYAALGIEEPLWRLGEETEEALKGVFARIDATAEYNQLKVLSAFQAKRVSADCFHYAAGYGYDDIGRDTLESVYALVFRTEDALVRPQIACGTHAIATALFGLLRPGDELLAVTGKPYDTLDEVIGLRPAAGSLAEYGISYAQADLTKDGKPDYAQIGKKITSRTKLAHIQRSNGYALRPALGISAIKALIRFLKEQKTDLLVMVDNCYGEFVEEAEPAEVGADVVCGSLIKNPGGGLAPLGGYIVGKQALMEQCAARLTAPGVGREVGASLGVLRRFYQGLFLAPTVTASALKTAVFAAALFEKLGFSAFPAADQTRHDIIQSVVLRTPAALNAFCAGIQKASPVDSYVTPIAERMPGYADPVIMAAGNFIQGASIELSADGPMREPYAVYFQGGLTYPHGKYGILSAAQALYREGLLKKP